MKRCPDCGYERPLDDFYRALYGHRGRNTYCKEHERLRKAARRIRLNALPKEKD